MGTEAQRGWYLADENSGAGEHRQVITGEQGGPSESPFRRSQSPWLPVLSYPVVLDFRLASTSGKEGNACRAVHLRSPPHRDPCSKTGQIRGIHCIFHIERAKRQSMCSDHCAFECYRTAACKKGISFINLVHLCETKHPVMITVATPTVTTIYHCWPRAGHCTQAINSSNSTERGPTSSEALGQSQRISIARIPPRDSYLGPCIPTSCTRY